MRRQIRFRSLMSLGIVAAMVLTSSCTAAGPGEPAQGHTGKSETTREYALAPVAELKTQKSASLESDSKATQPIMLEPTRNHSNTGLRQPTRDTTGDEQRRNAPRERPTATPQRFTTATTSQVREPTRATSPTDRGDVAAPQLTSDGQAASDDWALWRIGDAEDWLMAGIAEADRRCFPSSVKTNEEVKAFLQYLDHTGEQELNRCLSDEAEFGLHLLEREGSDISGAEEFCIWQGMRVASRPYQERATGAAFSVETHEQAEARYMAEVAITAYCTRQRANSLDERAETESPSDQRRRILTCLVERIGGPARFMAANLEENTLLEEIDQALRGEGTCGKSR